MVYLPPNCKISYWDAFWQAAMFPSAKLFSILAAIFFFCQELRNKLKNEHRMNLTKRQRGYLLSFFYNLSNTEPTVPAYQVKCDWARVFIWTKKLPNHGPIARPHCVKIYFFALQSKFILLPFSVRTSYYLQLCLPISLID